jgi:hypothetical protein
MGKFNCRLECIEGPQKGAILQFAHLRRYPSLAEGAVLEPGQVFGVPINQATPLFHIHINTDTHGITGIPRMRSISDYFNGDFFPYHKVKIMGWD